MAKRIEKKRYPIFLFFDFHFVGDLWRWGGVKIMVSRTAKGLVGVDIDSGPPDDP